MLVKRITTCVIVASTSAALCVAAHANEPENLAPNGSFEEPVLAEGRFPIQWESFQSHVRRISLTEKTASAGKQSLSMTAQQQAGAHQGLYFRREVKRGEKYRFSAKVTEDGDDRPKGPLMVSLVIEWKNRAGKEITRHTSEVDGSRDLSTTRWRELEIRRAIVPSDAVEAVFGIHLKEGRAPARGTVYIDEIVLTRE